MPSWIQSTAPKLLLCQKGQRAKMGQHLEVGTAANRLVSATQIILCAGQGEKLNTCSFLLFWLSCLTANLSCFLAKLAASLNHKHLSHPLCTLTSPQLCSFFVWRWGRWVDAKRHRTYILTVQLGYAHSFRVRVWDLPASLLKRTFLCVKCSFLYAASYE